MSAEHLDSMQLNPDQAFASVEFLESYANLCLSEIQERSGEGDDVWTATVDAATALREAGQWALCVDPQRGFRLLDRAGDLFLQAGYAFGTYLKVVASYWSVDPPMRELRVQLERLEQIAWPSPPPEGQQAGRPPEPPAADALAHPQQQAYLLLAAAGSRPVAEEFGQPLRRLALESPHRAGVVPVGALGMPIRRFWAIAAAVLGIGDLGTQVVATHISALLARYAESIELAMTNEYLWQNAAAPVDLGDIDIMGTFVIASRAFGSDAMADALMSRLPDDSYPARAQAEMAMEVAAADPWGSGGANQPAY
jgi:hypothetical protein